MIPRTLVAIQRASTVPEIFPRNFLLRISRHLTLIIIVVVCQCHRLRFKLPHLHFQSFERLDLRQFLLAFREDLKTQIMEVNSQQSGDAGLVFDTLDIDLVVKVLSHTAFSQ